MTTRQQPRFDAEVPPDRLDILNERLCRIVMQFTESVDGEGAASTASALINPNDAIPLWVEVAPIPARAKRAARAAMQMECGLPVGVARNFPVDFVSVGDTEKPCIERINRRIELIGH